jgi:hypothetical protein
MTHEAGTRSQVAQLAFAAVVVVVLLFLTGLLQYLPHCVLASIVFAIAVYGWFTEGFDTPVLQDAKELLDQLGWCNSERGGNVRGWTGISMVR